MEIMAHSFTLLNFICLLSIHLPVALEWTLAPSEATQSAVPGPVPLVAPGGSVPLGVVSLHS